MTDNEIVKALECCSLDNRKHEERCSECPMYETPLMICQNLVAYYALDLINRPKAEIERLKEVSDNECDSCACVLLDQRDSAKVEAIKEFAERLKDELKVSTLWGLVSFDRIDNLVKEMTEGNSNG